MFSFLWPLILGWISGGLVNYLADVLPRTRKLSPPRCAICGERSTWVSLILPAPCQQCAQPPPIRNWIVQPGLAGVSLLLWWFPLQGLGYYGSLLWAVYFSLVMVIDIEHKLILHLISILGGILGAGTGIFLHGVWNTLLGGAAGFGIMLLFYVLGDLFVRFLSRTRGEAIEETALGFGDVNLSGVIGLLLGWPGVLAGILLAILLGGLVSGLYLLSRLAARQYTAFQALPYGPFLIISAAGLLIYARV